MKNLVLIIALVVVVAEAEGQQVYFKYGRLLSSFDYTDSEGNHLDLNKATNSTIGVGFRLPVAPKKLFLNTSINYNKYGASGSDPIIATSYQWDVDYVGIQLQGDYEFYRIQNYFINEDGFTFYLKGGFATEFMVQGVQRINDQLYDLSGVEQFDKPVFFLRGGLGANYCVSRKLSIFIEYNGGKSFALFGKSPGDQEELRYTTHAVSFGLSLNLPSCEYCNRSL